MRLVPALLLLAASLAAQAQERNLVVAEQRVALVIGNAAYKVGQLRNPVNDARAMTQALKTAGFHVDHRENLTHRQMFEATRDFGERLKPGAVALFYYAGHGLQVRDRNYLIPVEADLRSEEEAPYTSIDASYALDVMNRARTRVNIVILDACRNNPFAKRFRSGASGLAQMEAPSGTLIAYATAPGRVASDGAGEHGLYTQHLLEHLATPGLPVELLFKRVRESVERETKSQQVPWESSSLKGDFSFVAAAAAAAPAPASAAAPESAFELAFWDSIKASSQLADYQAYLAAYPKGRFAPLARARIAALEKQAGQQADGRDAEFWDSIRASVDPAEYQAYLEQFPNGRFAGLARARISSLKVAAAKPAPVPAPAAPAAQPAAPLPAQVAAVAPAASVATAGSGRAPAVGERWVYDYADLWKPGEKIRLTHAVTAVNGGEVTETISALLGGRTVTSEATWPAAAEIREWKLDKLSLREFSPFAAALELVRPGQAPGEVSVRLEDGWPRPWTVAARASEEDVTVPAGRFRATRVVLSGQRAATQGTVTAFEMTVWYAPEVKRYVKMTYASYLPTRGMGNSTDPWQRELYELVSAPPRAGPAAGAPQPQAPSQLAAAAPTPLAALARRPAVGDRWVYEYTDLWKPGEKLQVTHAITAVSAREIVERISAAIGRRTVTSEASWPVAAEMGEWQLEGFAMREFSPFALALGLVRPGQAPATVKGLAPEAIDLPDWSVRAVVREEDVSVPAGTFRAVKVMLVGTRPVTTMSMQRLHTFEMTVWYAPQSSRAVRIAFNSYARLPGAPSAPQHRELYELVSAPR